MPRNNVTHLRSSVATTFEAARLAREKVQALVPTLDSHFGEFCHVTLCGACAIASYILHVVLRRLDVKNDLVMGRMKRDAEKLHIGEHCWVEIKTTGLIVDITATQFGIANKVHVTSADDSFYQENCRGRKAMKEMLAWDMQSPFRHVRPVHSVIREVIDELELTGYIRKRIDKGVTAPDMC